MSTAGSPGGGSNYTESGWASQVLQDIGAPNTTNNIDNMMRWMTREEPTSNWFDRNNPLNASLGTNSTDGTGSYSNLSVGAQETANMIQQSNMSGIDTALLSNANKYQFSSAVVASPWASSHYGWNPNAIANIRVPGGGTPASSGGSSSGSSSGSGGGGGGGGANSPSTASNDVVIPFLGIDLSQIGRYAIWAVIALVILVIGGLLLAGGTIGSGGAKPVPVPIPV